MVVRQGGPCPELDEFCHVCGTTQLGQSSLVYNGNGGSLGESRAPFADFRWRCKGIKLIHLPLPVPGDPSTQSYLEAYQKVPRYCTEVIKPHPNVILTTFSPVWVSAS